MQKTNEALLVERNYWNKGIHWGDLGFKLNNTMGSGKLLLISNQIRNALKSYNQKTLRCLVCSSMLDCSHTIDFHIAKPRKEVFWCVVTLL